MHNPRQHAIGLKQKLALGCGYFTVFFLGQAIPILAIPHYQMTLGVNPGLLGLLMALPLLLASCFGVWFGHWADKFQSRFGRRRPFMFFASVFTALSYGLLWMPPAHWAHGALLVYFGGLSLVFQLASVIYSISLNSLVYESSPSSHERTRLMGFTTYFVKLGSLCYQWLYPLSAVVLIGGVALGVQGVGWLLGLSVFLIMGLLPVFNLREAAGFQVSELKALEFKAAELKAPELKSPALNTAETKTSVQSPTFVCAVKTTLSNRAMVFILTLTLLQMGGAAYAATMDYYLLVYFVSAGDIVAGAISKGVLSTAYALVSMLSVPFILYLVKRRGRLQALLFIYGINALGGCAKWFLFVPDIGLWIMLDAILCGTVWSAMVIIIPSMIADLAHNEGLSAQASRSGIYASIYGWVLSLSGVCVLMISGFTLSAIGFDAALGGAQAQSTLQLMRIILALGTVAFSLLAIYLVMRWQARPANYQFANESA